MWECWCQLAYIYGQMKEACFEPVLFFLMSPRSVSGASFVLRFQRHRVNSLGGIPQTVVCCCQCHVSWWPWCHLCPCCWWWERLLGVVGCICTQSSQTIHTLALLQPHPCMLKCSAEWNEGEGWWKVAGTSTPKPALCTWGELQISVSVEMCELGSLLLLSECMNAFVVWQPVCPSCTLPVISNAYFFLIR